jgi:hypothetical protein
MKPVINIFIAANGQKSARLASRASGDIALFSAYNPGREAKRFAAAALLGKKPELIVILGAGLGHLEAAAAHLAPGVRIVPVYFAAELDPGETGSDGRAWNPGHASALVRFLAEAVGECDPRSVEIIEWPTAAQAFPELARAAREALVQALKQGAWGGLTVAGSGRRWLTNTLVNFMSLEAPVGSLSFDPARPLVIAAAGPSLAKALPLLSAQRGRYTLVALASSLQALRHCGLEPDLVVATDAGYYASHLLTSARGRIKLLAMPLSAARGAWRAAERVFLFAQPNFFELELLGSARASVPAVDAHGTVAGSALLLARAVGAREIFFCGLDCCYDDIRSHCSPHPYEGLVAASATRLISGYSAAYGRALDLAPERLGAGCRTSTSLSVYAASFESLCADADRRVFRLFPSPVPVPGMAEAAAADFERAVSRSPAARPQAALSLLRGYPDARTRKRLVRARLDEWLRRLADGVNTRELVRFLSGRLSANGADAVTSTVAFLSGLRGRLCGDFHSEGEHA